MTDYSYDAFLRTHRELFDEQTRMLELCTCEHTRGVHFRSVLRGEYVAPCALCACPDFKPEDYVPLDNGETASII